MTLKEAAESVIADWEAYNSLVQTGGYGLFPEWKARPLITWDSLDVLKRVLSLEEKSERTSNVD